jgi:hypothetical protein
MDTKRIRDLILKEGHYLVVSPGKDIYYGFKVVRKQELMLTYNFATETTNNTGPMVPYGWTSIPSGYQNYYVEINKLPLAKIQNVTDMFKIENDNEIWQVFMGIAPSYLKVGLRINTASATAISNSIAPSQSFLDLFAVDGFTSPFDEPAPESEFFAMTPLTIGLTLMNPVTIPINPRIQFFINRMIVDPIPPNVQNAIMSGSVPAKKVSIGNVTTNLGGFDVYSDYQIKVGGV